MILIVAEPPAIPVDSHQIHQIPGMAGEIPGNPEITGKQFPQTKPLTSEPPRFLISRIYYICFLTTV